MPTLAEHLKSREAKNTKALLELLRITEEERSRLLFNGAYQYLEKVFGTDAYGMEHLPMTKEFWTWWRMEWAKIDSIFLSAVDEDFDRTNRAYRDAIYRVRDRENSDGHWIIKSMKELREQYSHYHESNHSNRYLTSDVVTAGMHEMINAITHNKTKKEVNNG